MHYLSLEDKSVILSLNLRLQGNGEADRQKEFDALIGVTQQEILDGLEDKQDTTISANCCNRSPRMRFQRRTKGIRFGIDGESGAGRGRVST